jgi:coenzyme PQQ synthesis protein D (PqqD)
MTPKARQTDVLVHSVDDEVVVYDKKRKEAHRLNETVSKVWLLLDGNRSIDDIAAELEVDESVVSLSIDELVTADLLDSGEALSVSRRSALRQVATAAAIGFMLPAITSIAAPMAAQAESQRGDTRGSYPNIYDSKGSGGSGSKSSGSKSSGSKSSSKSS